MINFESMQLDKFKKHEQFFEYKETMKSKILRNLKYSENLNI